jgi:hypothetical protein
MDEHATAIDVINASAAAVKSAIDEAGENMSTEAQIASVQASLLIAIFATLASIEARIASVLPSDG